MSEKDLRILQAIECSTMVSTWHEYLCLEKRDGRVVLFHRRYEMLGEVSDFAVETEEGEQEYQVPDVIDGKAVVGTDDGFIMGGELTEDPSDPEPEIDLADADPEKIRDWLTARGFDPEWGSEAVVAKVALDGSLPSPKSGDESCESDGEEVPVQPISAADIGPVTQIKVRLQRWMDFPATAENDYPAEVIKDGDSFYYRARGVTVPITAQEALQVISNPFLYYFSTALKLHKRIDNLNGRNAIVQDVRDES